MKPQLFRGALLAFTSIILFGHFKSYATATANSHLDFSGLTITPASGTLSFLTNWSASAFAQATDNNQFNAGNGLQSAGALGDYSFAQANGDANLIQGFALANASVPGQIDASDSATARGALSATFVITGGVGPVSTSFAVNLNGSLNAITDTYGQLAEAESIFSLEVDGAPTLFNTQLLSIGPNASDSALILTTLNNSLILQFNTPYYLYAESDTETFVVNVPEPGAMALLGLGCGIVWCLRRKLQRFGRSSAVGALLIAALLNLSASKSYAIYIGSDAPDVCQTCGYPSTREPGGMLETSLSEGNLREEFPVVTVRSESGPTIPFKLTYNSYNADNSRARVDVGLGFGWTHTYNIFLFRQKSHYFRMDGEGRVTQYRLGGGAYTADPGWFETFNPQPDGSLIITNKSQSWWRFASVPNTTYAVAGPIYRLTHMGDRNQNISTLSYSNGVLVQVTDHYGRSITFSYTNGNHLARVTDPLGRVTRFQYDNQFRAPTRITDSDGKITRYTYNSSYQLTRKIDRDMRVYFYLYRNQKPYQVLDGLGQTVFALSNPTKWEVNRNTLALLLRRQYTPTTTSKTNGLGFVWRYTYNTNGYITRVVAPDGSATSYAYDSSARLLTSVTNANGAVTRYQYDSLGNRVSLTDALGNITTYTYEPVFNQMASATDPNGRVTTYQYDASGNRVREIDPLNKTNSWSYDSQGNVISETDKLGRTTSYIYDTSGNRTNRTDALGNVTTYTYDGVGNRIATTDALGRTTQYAYDARDRTAGSTDMAGGVTTYQYDALDRRTQQTDANGDTTIYGYDTRGRLTQTTDPQGNTTTYGYDANNNRTAVTNRNGHDTEFTYDLVDRPIRSTNAIGGITTSTYDGVGNRLTETDPLGRTTHYQYDPLNRVIRSTDALGGVTHYDYGSVGGPPCCTPTAGSSHITRLQDANGKVTFFKYDELDRLTQVIRKNGDTNDVVDINDGVTTYAYDAVNNRIATTDANGNTTTYAYDSLNRLTTFVNAASDATTHIYDGVGNRIVTTSPNGNVTTYTYDSLNRQIATTDSAGLLTTTTYDPVGNQLGSTNALGYVTTYTYDSLDRRITTTDALGNTTTTQYDPEGNVIQSTDRQGHVTTYTYDSLERHIGTTNALGHISTTTYDGVGNRTSVTDASGNVTTYTYDSLNRRIAEINPDPFPNTTTCSYDGVGNRISRTDQQGRVTSYNYNDLYQRTNRGYAPSGINENYTYDLGGRMLSANRAGWIVTYAYDAADRVIATTQNGVSVTHSYNIPARAITNNYPSGRTIEYIYDARDRLVTVRDPAFLGAVTTYTYDAANRVVTRAYRNGSYAIYSYDANNWVTSLEHSNGVARIAGFGYDYDLDGNRLIEEKRHMTLDSETYEYDAIHRLTNFAAGTLVGPTIPSPALLKTWTLDPLGNWSLLVSNSIPQPRTHNAANEITTLNGNPIFHDDSGNLQQDTGYAYLYDEESRLTQVTRLLDSAIVGQYWYDAMGRRVVKVANPAGVAVTNVFIYDNARILEELNSSGTTIATYTYGNYVDEVLTMDRAGQTHYYHQNSQWSPHALSDGSGNVVERYTYDAYGSPTILDSGYLPLPLNAWGTQRSAVTNSFLFTGRELDEESGLFHFRARALDCNKGRFLQRDQIGMADSENLYLAAFVPNFLDPSGNQRVESCSEGGVSTCRVTPAPTCTCLNPRNNGPWNLSRGVQGDANVTVHATRTYDIVQNNGTRATVTCDRLQRWRDRSRDHENTHVVNCRGIIARMNGAHSRDYDTQAACERGLDAWVRGWSEYSDRESAHTNPESPRPTDCAAEFRDEMAAGECQAPVPR